MYIFIFYKEGVVYVVGKLLFFQEENQAQSLQEVYFV